MADNSKTPPVGPSKKYDSQEILSRLKEKWSGSVSTLMVDRTFDPKYTLTPDFAAREAGEWTFRFFERKLVSRLDGTDKCQGYKLVTLDGDYEGFPFSEMLVESEFGPSGHVTLGEERCEDGVMRPELYLAVRPKFIDSLINEAIAERSRHLFDVNEGALGQHLRGISDKTGGEAHVKEAHLQIGDRKSAFRA